MYLKLGLETHQKRTQTREKVSENTSVQVGMDMKEVQKQSRGENTQEDPYFRMMVETKVKKTIPYVCCMWFFSAITLK